MPSYPWLSVTNSNQNVALWAHKTSFRDIITPGNETPLDVVTLIGTRHKSHYLGQVLGYTKPVNPHGQVRIALGSRGTGLQHGVFLDCEISLTTSHDFLPNQVNCTPYTVSWLRGNQQLDSEDFLSQVVSHVLTPLSSVLCYFSQDMQGIDAVIHALARQAVSPRTHSLPCIALPYILIVVETRSKAYNAQRARKAVRSRVLREMMTLKAYSDAENAIRDLEDKFRDIQVVGLNKASTQQARALSLTKRLDSLQKEAHWARRTGRYLFKPEHLDAFSTQILSNFTSQRTCFDFLSQSRPDQFDARQVRSHVDEFLALLPGQNWLWKVVVPLLASAFCLASYPPGSHNFSPDAVFEKFFVGPCQQSIVGYTQDTDVHHRFIASIKAEMEEIFRRLDFDASTQSALLQHTQCLEDLWPHLAEIKSHRSCMSCFMCTPEKVFHCGHAVCDTCVRRFGSNSLEGRHTFEVPACMLCGVNQPREKTIFRMIPPTAGIRILSLDGGGVRGVIPLIFLQHLESELSAIGGSIHNMFDYVCGTSAGGLIAIGIFLMAWTPAQCLQRFEELAITVFNGKQQDTKLSWSKKLHRLLRVCVQDYRYNLSPVERAFLSTIGPSASMFNPLHSDTKVAVTATSVRANKPCVISNYNGSPRSDESNYCHVRAARCCHDITISDAAACTSAAPFFFKSKDVNHLDTFQDGGLRHNCPALLASWECGNLWPDKCQIFDSNHGQIDHMISIGTGTSTSVKYEVGPHSPKKDRFLERLVGNYMCHLDAEEQWRAFLQCVPARIRARYHRLNVSLPGTEPALDDITAMERLKAAAYNYIHLTPQISMIKDTMIASMFYLEVDRITQNEGGTYQCSGTIFCRFPHDYQSRRALYSALLERHAFFMVNGHGLPCTQSIPKGMPIFRKTVEIVVDSFEAALQISLTGITSEPTLISGMPTQLDLLVKAQGLEMPFGCLDQRSRQRQLPATPSKRKICDI